MRLTVIFTPVAMILSTQAQLNFKDAPHFQLDNIISEQVAAFELKNKLQCQMHIDEIFTFICSAINDDYAGDYGANVVLADARSVIGE